MPTALMGAPLMGAALMGAALTSTALVRRDRLASASGAAGRATIGRQKGFGAP